MDPRRKLLWVDKWYFTGWRCSECLWRAVALWRNRHEKWVTGEFEVHDCSRNQAAEFAAHIENPRQGDCAVKLSKSPRIEAAICSTVLVRSVSRFTQTT
jgi:hypothetical protein